MYDDRTRFASWKFQEKASKYVLRYVWDKAQTHSILDNFNSIHPNLIFTEEKEQNNLFNYLDITINKTPPNIKISIYRKPAFTDKLIPYTSNHPTQHKYSAIRFLYGRLNSYHLDEEEQQREENIIQNILHNNSFPLPSHKPYTPNLPLKLQENKHKWNTSTYIGKETTYITNLFKHSNLQIAFHINNTLRNHLTHNTHNPDKSARSRVYQLTCPDCKKAYIGQTGRYFTSMYNEHKLSFWNNTHIPKFAQHLNEHMHYFGSIRAMQIPQFQKKGTTSKYHRTFSHPQGSRCQQLPQWWTHSYP